tara:strand:- start:30851 stop:31003 length:153 start_codon:yes stop_codon:yes gene_type:complete
MTMAKSENWKHFRSSLNPIGISPFANTVHRAEQYTLLLWHRIQADKNIDH